MEAVASDSHVIVEDALKQWAGLFTVSVRLRSDVRKKGYSIAVSVTTFLVASYSIILILIGRMEIHRREQE